MGRSLIGGKRTDYAIALYSLVGFFMMFDFCCNLTVDTASTAYCCSHITHCTSLKNKLTKIMWLDPDDNKTTATEALKDYICNLNLELTRTVMSKYLLVDFFLSNLTILQKLIKYIVKYGVQHSNMVMHVFLRWFLSHEVWYFEKEATSMGNLKSTLTCGKLKVSKQQFFWKIN